MSLLGTLVLDALILTVAPTPLTNAHLISLLRSRVRQELLKALCQVGLVSEELPHLAVHIGDFIQIRRPRVVRKKGQEPLEDFRAVRHEAVLKGRPLAKRVQV